jgi:hypothetical protein
MKKVMILLVVFCAFTVSAFAQQVAAPAVADKMKSTEGAAAQKPESWKSLLSLTPEQDTKMKEIGKAYKEKSDALKNDATLEKADRKAKMTELQATNDTDLKAVLGAEKFTKYMEIRKQRSDAKKAQQAAEKGTEKKEN